MTERDLLLGAERRLFAREILEGFGLQRLFDRAQAVGPLGVTRGGDVVETGAMRDEECGHTPYLGRWSRGGKWDHPVIAQIWKPQRKLFMTTWRFGPRFSAQDRRHASVVGLASPVGPWAGPVFLLDVDTRALPVFEVPAFRSAFLIPDEIGAFANPMLPLILMATLRILPLLIGVRHRILSERSWR